MDVECPIFRFTVEVYIKGGGDTSKGGYTQGGWFSFIFWPLPRSIFRHTDAPPAPVAHISLRYPSLCQYLSTVMKALFLCRQDSDFKVQEEAPQQFGV